jgi:hypothetical protein
MNSDVPPAPDPYSDHVPYDRTRDDGAFVRVPTATGCCHRCLHEVLHVFLGRW